MANFFNNLSFKVTNAGVTTGVSMGLGYVNSLFSRKDKACRFYYDKASGGVYNIMLKSMMAAGIAYAQKQALEQLKKLFFKGRTIGLRDTYIGQTITLIDNANNESGGYVIGKYEDGRKGKGGQITHKRTKFVDRKYGVMKVNNGDDAVVAIDFCGNWCPDAVMLGIPVKDKIKVNQGKIGDGRTNVNKIYELNEHSFDSDTLVWYDPTALVTIQSQKNYILTKVNGRDYTRKELISNGDIEFSITGRMNSNLPDVYPTNEISKFIQIMQYKGLVRINSQILDQFHIDKVFIKDFSMPQKEGFRNIQEYTINCVGSMPTEEVKVTNDTINILNTVIHSGGDGELNMWKALLKGVVEGLKQSAFNTISSGLSTAGGMLNNTI